MTKCVVELGTIKSITMYIEIYGKTTIETYGKTTKYIVMANTTGHGNLTIDEYDDLDKAQNRVAELVILMQSGALV